MGAGRKHRRPGEPAPRHDFLTRRVLERQFPVRREARGPVVGPATGWQLPVACSGTRCKGERARRADPSTTATIRSSSGINRRTARSTDARTRPSLPRRTSTAAASSARTAKARPAWRIPALAGPAACVARPRLGPELRLPARLRRRSQRANGNGARTRSRFSPDTAQPRGLTR